MKLRMKKHLRTLAAALSAAIVTTSCNGILPGSGPKMDTEEGTTAVRESFAKHIDLEKWKPYVVTWMEGEELGNDLQLLRVEMVNPSNGCFYQTFSLSGPGAGNISDLRETMTSAKPEFEKMKGITPEMIDPAAIQQQYEKAKSMIPEGYTFKSIGRYRIEEELLSGNPFLDRNKEAGRIRAEFTVNVTEDGKEYIESAGKKSIQYYQMEFNVLPDGSIEMED